MNRVFILCLASLLLVAGLVTGVVAISSHFRNGEPTVSSLGSQPDPTWRNASDVKQSAWLTEYTLTERSGRKFHSRDLAKQVHVVNFFFAKCPTSCRMQTGAVRALQKEFGPRGVTFLSITCDPKNDTPVALAQYALEFEADPKQWLFLTGDLAYLERVGAEVYFLPVKEQAHSESLLVVDRAGKIRGRFSWKDKEQVADMTKLLTELLAEPPPASSTVKDS